MITAAKLKELTELDTTALSRALAVGGYKGAKFKSSEFVGLTNAGLFAYKTVFNKDGEDAVKKVFVKYTHSENKVSADY